MFYTCKGCSSVVRNWLQEKETDESMSVLRISNKKSQCRFCEKHRLNAMKEIFLNMARQKDLHLNNFIKVWFMGKCDIWQFKTNPAMDVIVWEENNYERRKIQGNIKWITYNNLRFRIEKVNDDSSVIWVSDNFVNLCFTLVMNDF